MLMKNLKNQIESEKKEEDSINLEDYVNKRYIELMDRYSPKKRNLEEELRKTAALEFKYKAKFVYPTGPHILIKLTKSAGDEKSLASGIIIKRRMSNPDDTRFASFSGVIVAMGTGAYSEEMFDKHGIWATVGDNVIFQRHKGLQFNNNIQEENYSYSEYESNNHTFNVGPDCSVVAIMDDEQYITRE